MTLTFSIKFENTIAIHNIPPQWISLIDLYNTSLPQFPLKYVHLKNGNKRIFGFPLHYEIVKEQNGSLTWSFKFLSNVELKGKDLALTKVELEQRIGASNPVKRGDIETCCPKEDKRQALLFEIWDSFITPVYGGVLPFGRFYDGLFSFARCSAAFTPMSGGKSEWQMTYDFMRHYGEKVTIKEPWNFLEFFLLPTYDELLARDFKNFPTYRNLQSAIDKFGKRYFTRDFAGCGVKIRTVGPKISDLDGYDIRSPNGMRDLTSSLVKKKALKIVEKKELDFLIDAFNRLATRALGFIGLAYNATPANDLMKWDGPRFRQLYLKAGRTVGIYPKIWGMILQQGFGNPEVIPIDVWIEAFFKIPLQIDSKEKFLNSFRNIGKLERMFWVTSQARKTNMFTIFDWIWCLKFGLGKTTSELTKSSKGLRGANPLSCLKCPLKDNCLAYMAISDTDVSVMSFNKGTPLESKIKPKRLSEFVVGTIGDVPKYVYRKTDHHYKMIDAFTGLEIHETKTSFKNKAMSVQEFMNDLSRASH
ncbi:MAG: hypothetical protein ABSA79_09195 [Candidatus Bathyarchaeia archaeon]